MSKSPIVFDKPESYLSERGYAFVKSENEELVEELRKRLTVKPYVHPNSPNYNNVNEFIVYCESKKKIYLPRAYGLKHFGLPVHDQLKDGEDAPRLVFQGALREHQKEPVAAFLEAAANPLLRGGIISLCCGGGKCLAKDTPILMYDGTVKMVQDIDIGDLLMGDDSTPRKVLSTCTGEEEMFNIVPTKGDTYTVNRSHILSLRCATNNSKNLRKGTIIDISVNDYLNLPKSFHGRGGPLYGYRVGVEFSEKEVPFDPYLFGYWLGDGFSRRPGISTHESTVLRYISKLLPTYGMYLQYSSQYDYFMNGNKKMGNPFMKFLREFNLLKNKHIPLLYKCNSREIRMGVLAGFIDADGHYHVGGFDITVKSEKLIDDIIYLARSLGFSAYKKQCQKTCTNAPGGPKTGTYYRISINGCGIEHIPTKVFRKKALPRKQIKDVLMTRIKPVSVGMGTYYGFEIDGNRRFLLSDFTVTHNTACALYIACQLKKKTLVVCHKGFLMNQWKERIEQFVPNAKIGIIKQDKIITDDCDIVLASLQSLAMRDYPSSVFHGFHMTVIDEVHHTSAEVFSRALPKISVPVMLGLSATLKRSDGLSKVFEWYIGKPVFVSKRKDDSTDVLMLPYTNNQSAYCEEVRMWNGKLNVAQMITRICSFMPRNQFILDTLEQILNKEPGRKTLILSDRRKHLVTLEKMITTNDLGSVGYYVGGMKEHDLKESENKDIILGTFTMACIADNTILVDPITGQEHYIRDFEEHCKKERKDRPHFVSMYYETGKFYFSYCSRFGYSPTKPCVKIIHELGDITLSADHKVCTLNGWKLAGELTLSDYLITPRRIDVTPRDKPDIYNQDLWVLGCLLGQSSSIYESEKDVLNQVSYIMHKSPMSHELCMMAKLQETMETYSFIRPDLMFLPDEKLCSLVGGLFDSAGEVEGYKIYFTFYSVLLTNQLRTLLRRLHIRTTRTPCVKPGFPYIITVVPEDLVRFINILDIRGKMRQEKLTRLKQMIKEFPEIVETDYSNNQINPANPDKPNIVSDVASPVQIYAIYQVDPSTVKLCDVEIPVHHTFLASDIIIHNSEGMDIPCLNTLVLASPVSSIEQSVGRIQRQQEIDRVYTPLVIDIWDQFSLFKSQGTKRLQFYKKNKYPINTMI
jgi:superfamily II DNA or RNA helicase/intein/homing endonuclease